MGVKVHPQGPGELVLKQNWHQFSRKKKSGLAKKSRLFSVCTINNSIEISVKHFASFSKQPQALKRSF
jgi:hypothetical protein